MSLQLTRLINFPMLFKGNLLNSILKRRITLFQEQMTFHIINGSFKLHQADRMQTVQVIHFATYSDMVNLFDLNVPHVRNCNKLHYMFIVKSSTEINESMLFYEKRGWNTRKSTIPFHFISDIMFNTQSQFTSFSL